MAERVKTFFEMKFYKKDTVIPIGCENDIFSSVFFLSKLIFANNHFRSFVCNRSTGTRYSFILFQEVLVYREYNTIF